MTETTILDVLTETVAHILGPSTQEPIQELKLKDDWDRRNAIRTISFYATDREAELKLTGILKEHGWTEVDDAVCGPSPSSYRIGDLMRGKKRQYLSLNKMLAQGRDIRSRDFTVDLDIHLFRHWPEDASSFEFSLVFAPQGRLGRITFVEYMPWISDTHYNPIGDYAPEELPIQQMELMEKHLVKKECREFGKDFESKYGMTLRRYKEMDFSGALIGYSSDVLEKRNERELDYEKELQKFHFATAMEVSEVTKTSDGKKLPLKKLDWDKIEQPLLWSIGMLQANFVEHGLRPRQCMEFYHYMNQGLGLMFGMTYPKLATMHAIVENDGRTDIDCYLDVEQ